VKATQNQLQDLLELAAIDQQIVRTRSEIESLGKDARYQELQTKLRASSSDFVAATNDIDGLKLELKRVENDVELVRKREAKDQAALRTTSVVKDAQALQHELKTLERRRGELEDQELSLMQDLDTAQAALEAVTATRTAIEGELKEVIAALEQEQRRLVSGAELSVADRKRTADKVPADLLKLYETKAKRGPAIGRLIHSECGACRMSISATNLAEITKTPTDNLVFCPDCSAILVR